MTGRVAEKSGVAGWERSRTLVWQRVLLWVMMRLSGYLQRVSREKAMRFGAWLGNFAHWLTRHFVKRSQQYAHRNLQLTGFLGPEATAVERDAFIRRVFIHFCKSAVDFLRGPVVHPADLEELIAFENTAILQEAQVRGKGIIFVSAHIGNWEYAARYLVANGLPVTAVAREPESSAFAEYINALRENGGYRVLYRGSAGVREMLTALKRKEVVTILADQNSGDLFIPFLGVPAGTVAGPAILALQTGATLIVGGLVRLPDDTFRILIYPPIPTEKSGDKEADIYRIMTMVNQQVEEMVQAYPDQWLWLHNRWNSAFEETNRERAFPDGIPPELEAIWNSKAQV